MIIAFQRYVEVPRYDDAPGMTNDIPQPGQSYSKKYGTEPRHHEPR